MLLTSNQAQLGLSFWRSQRSSAARSLQ